MARIHVLQATAPNTYRIILHSATPAGSNSAGISWATAVVNSGKAFTRMVEGNGAGQITASEKANVLNGSVIECQFDFALNPAWTNAERNAALDAEADKLIAETLDLLGKELAWFGATRG